MNNIFKMKFMKKYKNKNKDKSKNKKSNGLSGIKLFILFFIIGYVLYLFLQLITNPVNSVTIVTGKISEEKNTEAYVVRDESVLNTNQTTDITLSLSEGSRVANTQVVGTYVNKNKEQWEQKIKDLDVKIQNAMNEQSNIYSSDIRKIESQIEEKINLINKTNETQLMAQYKSEIDSLIQKKAKISGDLSPSGSAIKQLIEERNGYETKLNESTDYIRATKSGVISNRIDGLEDVLTIKNLYNTTYKQLKEYKLRTDEIIPNNTKSVKIIDNYYCYLIIHINDEHKDNIAVGDSIKIRLNYENTEKISAVIDKIVDEDDGKTVYLKITENVENLIGYRKVSMDIIWWEYEGLKVPNKVIKKEEYGEVTSEDGKTSKLIRNYVTLLKYGVEYKVYVNILKQNDDYCIIENIQESDLEKLKLTNNDIIKTVGIYDKLTIN